MAEKPPEDLQRILGPNEQLELYIKQKIYHPKINIDSVAITTERIILRHPHALGLEKDYTDFNYQDISNVILDKGLVRSTVRCTLRLGGDPLALNDLPNSEAEKAYGIIRENLVRYQSPFTPQPNATQTAIQQHQPGIFACPKCGANVTQGQRFCGSCGTPIQS